MKRLFFLLLLTITGCYHSEPPEPLVAIQIQDRNGLTETISSPDRLEIYNKVDFLSSQPYKKILRVYKKDKKNHSKITTYHPNGTIWQYLEAEELRAHGDFKEWYPNGQLKIEAKVIGGTADVAPGSQHDWLFDGVSKVWDEKGSLLAVIPYDRGLLEGNSLYYYPSGGTEKELPYRQNLLEGAVIEYYEKGSLKSKTEYIKGSKQGISLGYFDNDQASWIEEYRDGLILKGTYYDEHGQEISVVENGMGFRAVFEGKTLSMLVQIFQGSPEGGVKQFTPQGEISRIYHIKNGRKNGEEINYFLSSEKGDPSKDLLPKLSMNWSQDTIHGTVKTWYNNGQLQSQREYTQNKKNGPSLAWYKEGTLMFVEEYEEDRLVKGQYYKKTGNSVSSVLNGNGVATLYDEDGVFLKKIVYSKGDPVDPEN